MKKIILPLLILTFPFIGLSAQIKYFNLDGINYRLVKDTINGNNNMSAKVITMGDIDYYKGEISIPSSVMYDGVEYPVTAIDNMAFRCCKQLTSITIPSSVVDIPAAAFYGCYNLQTIVVSDDNEKYDSRDNCNAIIETATNTLIASCEKTVVPQDVTAFGDCAFFGHKSLTSLTVDDDLEEMGRWVFLDCENIEFLNWNSSLPLTPVTKLLKSSLKKVFLGDSVSSISNYAFTDCKNLESINIPSTVKAIGVKAFAGCDGLKSITIPSSVEKICLDAFDMCDNIETLYWNSNENLSYVLPSLKSTLKTIVIGDSVTSLEVSAFRSCKNLISVSVSSGNLVYDSRNDCNAIIESASNKMILGCKTSTIPEGVTAIGENVFIYCSSPQTISLPSTLLSIADYAFSNCDSLQTLVIPANVNKIGKTITSGCNALTTLSVDPANTFYDSRDNCNAIIEKSTGRLIAGCNSSTIPAGVTAIAAYSLSGYKKLKSINCPSSLRVIEEYAFSNCVSLESVSFPSSLRVIGDYAFYNCNVLESVSFPSSMDSIGAYAFSYCKSLLSISIPSGVKTIETGAFLRCDTLTSVDIQPGVENIDNRAFYGCRSIKSLSIPPTVKIIDREVFDGCGGIRTAGPKGGGYDYEFSWDTIPANAFRSLNNLESVFIPKTVKAIYECSSSYITDAPDRYVGAVFEGCSNLKSITAYFKDTKLYRYYGYMGFYREFDMDYNLYKTNPVCKLTVLDDTITTFFGMLTDGIKELVISKDVKVINPGAFAYSPFTTYFTYRGLFYNEEYDYYYNKSDRQTVVVGSNLENIIVEAGNSKYTSNNGVLFNSEGDKLLAYPTGRKGDYKIPATVKVIQDNAFYNSKISSVFISKNVERVGDGAFERCDSLKEVTIEGPSEIGLNAFNQCDNIQGVWTRSATPGLMNIFESPQTIMVGDYGSISGDRIIIKPQFDNELNRFVSLVYDANGNPQTYFTINADKIVPPGSYKISVGILPSPDNRVTMFYPYIYGYDNSNGQEYVFNPQRELNEYPFYEIDTFYNNGNAVIKYDTVSVRPGRIRVEETVISMGYDTVVISGCIVVPDGLKDLTIRLETEDLTNNYSHYFLLDRVFFEPLDKDMSLERFAGTFTESVFNNATLYVPDGAIETYKAANGWKLFKNIAVNDKSYPADEVEVRISEAGYATFYYSDGDYVLPEGLSAMVVSGMFDDKLIYETIASGADNGVIPAGVPVILMSDSKRAGTYKLQLTYGSFEYDGRNLLYGSDVDTQTYADGNSRFYKLAYGPKGTDLKDVVGWYWGAADGAAFSIEGHKAWLALPMSKTKGMVGFGLSGDATYVLDIVSGQEGETIVHDLQGRSISAPTGPGAYIINGKTVIITE